MKQDILRRIPAIEELLNTPQLTQLAEAYNREIVVKAARAVVDELRSEVVVSEEPVISPDVIAERVASHIKKKLSPSMRRAVNAAGIVLHTGLGRAVLPPAAIEAMIDVSRGYSTLEIDVENGQRGSRETHFSDLLCELTGAEAATITNNNAAATMIILNTLAAGKEVIISRGQLVEIGGSFRMPDVMASSGAIMRDVGTTNKTHLSDYANAINENTGAIIRVHKSNYRIVGFFEEPSIQELVQLAKEHDLPLIDDLGSGALVDLSEFGIESEPLVQDSIKAGVDVTCFSGDKLLGGPQCGLIVGKAKWVKAIKKNPLARAFRVGKMEVVALEATLKLFLDKDKLRQTHPTYRMLSLTPAELAPRAESLAKKLHRLIGKEADVEVIDGQSQVGSGSVPAEMMPTKLVSVRPVFRDFKSRNKDISAETLAKTLRYNEPPIFARIHQQAVLFDLRTIQPDEDEIVSDALVKVFRDFKSRNNTR